MGLLTLFKNINKMTNVYESSQSRAEINTTFHPILQQEESTIYE